LIVPFSYQAAISGYQIIDDIKPRMLAKSAKSIETRIDRIKKQLMQIGEMRPGSLSQQYSAST
jgi:hypothetical protein